MMDFDSVAWQGDLQDIGFVPWLLRLLTWEHENDREGSVFRFAETRTKIGKASGSIVY